MTFEETTQFLYEQTPAFQDKGAAAYKPGLFNTEKLDELFKHPHKSYKTIHVGGTNGKGSTSHTLAAILQKAGYKVGLYTSPHLVDFRERIRVNGAMIPKQFVIDFVEKNYNNVSHIHPSFFELTMMMAFCYFQLEEVDVAIIVVGLGGRLDSTNIINPELSIITNISYDHIQFLGNTLEKIASEKAGIIKNKIPVVIGEADGIIKEVFINKANKSESKIVFAEVESPLKGTTINEEGLLSYDNNNYPNLIGELSGDCQIKNTNTILTAIPLLKERGFNIPDQAVYDGFRNVTTLTGLQGRWQKISDIPRIYCDTGHNEGGIKYIVNQLMRQSYENLRIIIGMVNDKDIHHVLELFPKDAIYYFTQANVSRALPVEDFKNIAKEKGLTGRCFNSVAEAYKTAIVESCNDDFIFIGGSNFIIADLLTHLQNNI